MKNIFYFFLFSFIYCFPSFSYCVTQTFVEVSSVTYRTITVSSGTQVRVDNFNGAGEGLLTTRNELLIQNLDASDKIYCAYDSSVSSDTVNSNKAGWFLEAAEKRNLNLGVNLTLNCIAEDSAGTSGVRLHVTQASWKRTLP